MSKGQITGLISPMLEKIRLRNIAKYVNGQKVLDIGCGRCALMSYLKNAEYQGIERDRAIDNPNNAKIHYLDIEKDILSSIGKYDSIVLCEIIEHFENPRKVISKLKMHLNKEGTIIISTSIPIRYKIHKYTSIIGLTSREASEDHKSLLGKKELFKLAEDCGLKIMNYAKTELWSKQIIVLGI